MAKTQFFCYSVPQADFVEVCKKSYLRFHKQGGFHGHYKLWVKLLKAKHLHMKVDFSTDWCLQGYQFRPANGLLNIMWNHKLFGGGGKPFRAHYFDEG